MPELPEIFILAKQMNRVLVGKRIENVLIFQPKCLNRPESDFRRSLVEHTVYCIGPLGKWIQLKLDDETRFFISLGMGGEICYLEKNQEASLKSKLILRFGDGTGFYITLWWFGYFHVVLRGENHPMTESLGPDPLMLSVEKFRDLIRNRKGSVKSFLLNQKRIRGIGNFYIQEILFKARIHPLREIGSLSEQDKDRLFQSILDVFLESIHLGSSFYELDFYGKKGKYGLDQMSFAYQKKQCCPICKARPLKIKTGSTSQYICPQCQKV